MPFRSLYSTRVYRSWRLHIVEIEPVCKIVLLVCLWPCHSSYWVYSTCYSQTAYIFWYIIIRNIFTRWFMRLIIRKPLEVLVGVFLEMVINVYLRYSVLDILLNNFLNFFICYGRASNILFYKCTCSFIFKKILYVLLPNFYWLTVNQHPVSSTRFALKEQVNIIVSLF